MVLVPLVLSSRAVPVAGCRGARSAPCLAPDTPGPPEPGRLAQTPTAYQPHLEIHTTGYSQNKRPYAADG